MTEQPLCQSAQSAQAPVEGGAEADRARSLPGEAEPGGTMPSPVTWQSIWQIIGRVRRRMGDVASDPLVMVGALLAILLLAGVLRFTGLNWDEHQHLHPDERFLTMVENSLEWPKSFKEYLDSSANPLSPYNRGHGTYVYGLFPVVLAKFLGQVTGKTGYDGVYLAGRAMSAVMDLLSILFVFLTAKRLYGVREGLLGSLLLALSVLNIQQAHFFTVDTTTTFFVTLTLYLAVRVSQGASWGSILTLGVAFGFAVACKISVLTFLLIIGLAYLLRIVARGARLWKSSETSKVLIHMKRRFGRLSLSFRVASDERCGPMGNTELFLLQALRAGLSILVVLVIAVLVFRIAQPHAFTGPGLFDLKLNPKWKENMDYISKSMSGEIDYPPSHQWAGRKPVRYVLKNLVLWGLGLPLGLAVWASWALMAYELYKKHKWSHLLPWVWMSLTFFYQSIQFVKTMRYLLPIYPTMAMMAGYGLVWLWDWAKRRTQYATSCSKDGSITNPGARRRWIRPLALAMILLVVLGTGFWAVAFTGIYTRPVTRVTASRWIYRNIPRGSSISFELWDDPVPLNVDGHIGGAEYNHVQMEPYWEDTSEKREKLYSWLEQTEYLALSSNRLWGSIPRLPTRFPMTTHYYRALFSGELGYDRLVTFTSRPKLLGIEIKDDDADESFTVYDHPKVIIFKKRPDFSMEKVRAMFDGYELERIVRVKPLQLTTAPNNLMLTDADLASQRDGGTWSRIFHRQSLANKLPTVTWLLALYLVGLVAFPLGFVAFRRLRDRGYILSKTLGILLLGYLSWLLPSLKLLPYTRATIAGVLLALALVSAAVAWRKRHDIEAFWRARWRLLLTNELLFLGFFLVFWLIRRGNPDLWHPAMGGEKPMDMAYLNAIIKSTYFPPYDPWFAGGYINYYYFGWVTVASLIKLTGIVPWVAYNLILPTFFALVAMGASCVVFNLIPSEQEDSWFPRALRYGIVGACLVAMVGNLGELQLLLNGLRTLGDHVRFESTIPGLASLVRMGAGLGELFFKGKQLPFRGEWWYWNASRIMKHGEINEFPFFTFLYADLHAHLTAMPFAILALALAGSFLTGSPDTIGDEAQSKDETSPVRGWQQIWDAVGERARRVDWGLGLRLTLLALAVGELWCNNSWDFPTYAGIAVVALAIGIYGDRQQINQHTITQFALRAGYVLILSMLLYRPYHANFGLAYASVQRWKGERTPLSAYLIIHLTPLFILVSYLLTMTFERGMRNGVARAIRLFRQRGERRQRAWHLYDLLVRCQSLGYELAWIGFVFLGVVLLALFLTKSWVLLLMLPVLVLAGLLTLYSKATPERRFQTFLVAVGVALTLGVEYVVIKGDIGRMNTVFKFYLQVWIIWGIVAGVALAHLARRLRSWPHVSAKVWRTILVLLVVSVSLYPIFATYGKVRDRWIRDLPSGLDGMRYMTRARYHDNNRELILEYDRQAITWMQDHIVGSPVIAEANTPLYRWGNRISIYTGLPAIIGWDWHQKQQRAAVSGQVVDWRLHDLRELYDTHDIITAIRILERYHVGYIYVGELEQAYYDAQGLAKFEQMVGSTLEVAYQRGPVTIYRVIGSGAGEVAAANRSPRASGDRVALWDWFARHWVPGTVKAEGPEKEPSGNLAEEKKGPTLMLDEPVDHLPVVDGRGWNSLAKGNTLVAILCWWLVLEAIGLAVWPLVACVFPRFSDKGYALSKGIGLLLASYLVWIGSSLRLVAHSPPVAWLGLAALGACSFFLLRRQRHNLQGLSRGHKHLILFEESLFSGAFLAFVGVRILNPDLWQPWFGGEKMMEMAYLNALVKSAHMPPYDPYFAGGYLNYYYFGQFISAMLIKLTGLAPEVSFNLAVPTFFALTVSHAFTLGYHLAGRATSRKLKSAAYVARALQPPVESVPEPGPGAALARVAPAISSTTWPVREQLHIGRWAGLSAVVLVVIMGNLSGALQLLEQFARAGGASFTSRYLSWDNVSRIIPGLVQVVLGKARLPPFEYWYRGTRIIPYTISEFPFFSFLFADLHPHMIGIPFTMLVVALCLAVVLDDTRDRLRSTLRWLVLAVAVGALGIINTWDLPAYLGMLGCVMLYRGYKSGKRRGLIEALASFLLLGLVSLLMYGPFFAHYQAQHVGVHLVPPEERTRLAPFLVIWGFYLFLTISLIFLWIAQSWPWARLHRLASRRGWLRTLRLLWALRRAGILAWALSLIVLVVGGGCALLFWAADGMWLLALLTPLLIASAILVLWSRDGVAFIQRLLVFIALGMLCGVEIIYMKDFLAGCAWRRMNTVFKFYIQAWVMLGLAVGSVLPLLWKKTGVLWPLWRGVFVFLLISSLIYTMMSVPVRVNERFPSAWPPRGTLDGTAYMTTGIYFWPDEHHPIELRYDREAIEWLWDNVPGTPVIAEAPLGFYREGGLRVSSYTGLPTLSGAHEREQRPWEQVEAHERDAETLYTTTDIDELFAILGRHRVRYIYVGQLERTIYGEPGMTKFEELVQVGGLARAFHNDKVDVYKVLQDWDMVIGAGASVE